MYKTIILHMKFELWGANMRYIMTIIWSLLISFAVSYVLTSMAGEPFVVAEAVILAAIFAIITFFMGDVVLKEKSN